jgi:hypothetical protein
MAQIVSLTFAKLAGFAIASVLLVFVSSNFKAHKHHEALYKFRAMVLKTVELISIAKNLSSELQSTLILEAFRAVCSEKASGYITKEDVEPATKMFSDAFMGSMRGDEK